VAKHLKSKGIDFEKGNRIGRSSVLLLALTSLLAPSLGWARWSNTYFDSRYLSARCAAMAGSCATVVDTPSEALFVNPTASSKFKKFFFDPANIQLHFRDKSLAALGPNIMKVPSLESTKTLLESTSGGPQGLGIEYLPSVGLQSLSFGMLGNMSMYARSQDANLIYRSEYQLIPAVNFSLPLARGIFKIGYSGQWVNQSVTHRTIDLASTGVSYRNGLYEGSGLSHNMGLSITLPYVYLPSVHIIARNIGNTSFGSFTLFPFAGSERLGTPPDELASYDLAAGFIQRISGPNMLAWNFEFKDMTGSSGRPLSERLSLGFEMGFNQKFYLRAGWGMMHPSAGIGFKFNSSEINFTWFNERLRENTGAVESSTKLLFQYQLRVF
jgi:hypothetical protein